MKINIKTGLLMAIFFTIISCQDDLNTLPDGSEMTKEQVGDVVKNNPDRLKADVNGQYSLMKAYRATGYGGQRDFGIPSIASMLEHSGPDCVGFVIGYNWFSGSQNFENRNYTYASPHIVWNQFYKQIKLANSIIAKVPADSDDTTLKEYLGQAYAVRAYDYLNLVQLYQFTYKGHEQAPSVPIVKEDTPGDIIANNPRASVQEVYDLIKSDLDKAVDLLEGFSRPDKSVINQAVAYGLRARMNLVLNNWADAAADADKALTLSGEQPMSMADVSVPTFDDATAPGILWGIIITPEDDCAKSVIENFTSMFVSLPFGNSAYTTAVDVWKKISVLLYDKIPTTDVRKGWWINENYTSPNLESYESSAKIVLERRGGYDPNKSLWKQLGMHKYTHVKFAPVDKNMLSTSNSTDFPLMRAEEMILIKAEAKAMSAGVAVGKQILENFVKTYRDPSYVCTAASTEEFQDEIYLQKRMEFWGEGITWFDMMRLKKPIIRKDATGKSNFGPLSKFNVPTEAPYLLWPIPQSEIQSNAGISDTDNNDMGALPKP